MKNHKNIKSNIKRRLLSHLSSIVPSVTSVFRYKLAEIILIDLICKGLNTNKNSCWTLYRFPMLLDQDDTLTAVLTKSNLKDLGVTTLFIGAYNVRFFSLNEPFLIDPECYRPSTMLPGRPCVECAVSSLWPMSGNGHPLHRATSLSTGPQA